MFAPLPYATTVWHFMHGRFKHEVRIVCLYGAFAIPSAVVTATCHSVPWSAVLQESIDTKSESED